MRTVTSIEELDRNILTLCTRINAATYELLVLIREFEERGGHLKWGLENCAEWLAWRCDLSMTTALEKVRVARALKTLPLISSAFSTGELSYSKVRAMTRVASASNEKEGRGNDDNYLVTIHVDQSALAGQDGRSSLPIESVKRLCCDSTAVVLTEDNGQPLSIGRRSRIVPTALQRAVRARDNNTCTFPGCPNHRFLHCHHVEHWTNGGETALDNLMLLCTKHHTLVHEGGFRIDKDFNERWVFYRPDGIAVPDVGYHSLDWLDTDTGEVSTAYDNPPAGGLLSVADRSVTEPVPPAYLH